MTERTDDESRRDALATLRPALGEARRRRHRSARCGRARAAGGEARGEGAPDAARPAGGRGRKLAAPPAKVVAERLGIPVLQPERLTGELELPADTVVVSATAS